MGEGGGEALVVKHHGDARQFLFQPADGGSDVAHRLGGLACHGGWEADDYPVDGFAGYVVFDKRNELSRRHGGESRRDNPQRVGHGNAAALPSVVNGE